MDIPGLEGIPRYDPNPEPEATGTSELGKDAFLSLLTTQLQNQDPTDPVANEDFVAQLAQFSSLEQLVGLQETMDSVYTAIAAMNNSSMSSLLGREVVAVGNGFTLPEKGGIDLNFEANGSYEGAQSSIFDEDGKVVYSGDLPPGGEGEDSFYWDGRDLSGQFMDAGNYTFEITPVSEEGTEIRELIVGEVDEMDYSSGLPQPSVNGVVVGLDAILRLTSGSDS